MFTMFHKIAQCSLLLTFIAQVHSQQIWRIINGTETDIQEAPYTVSLLQDTIYGWDFFCGATLAKVNSVQVVITAAHCVASPGPPDENGNPTPGPRDDGGVIKIKAGTTSRHEGPFRIAEDIIWHEGFNWEMYDGNDIAVIFLEKKFKLSDRIREAKLPVQELGIDSLFVTGWGETKARSETLLKINLPLLPNDECSRHPEVNATVPDIMLCTYWAPQGGGSATCPGDSGGPGVVKMNGKYILYGVVSGGPSKCGEDQPAYFTKVLHYVDWIKATVDNYYSKTKKQ